MWIWKQKAGQLWRRDADGADTWVISGYSGHADGKNNPDMQSVSNVGPIPQGLWHIVELLEQTPSHGPYVLRLAPDEKTNTFGRSGFLIHGDSKTAPGSASLGCVILPRVTREQVWQSNDRALLVVA